MRIRDIVNELVEKYKTRDPFELIDSEDGIYYFQDLHHSVDGLFFREFDSNIICINDLLCDEMKKIVAAHELGHLKLHPHINRYTCRKNTFVVTEKFEVQANAFAAELLISDERYFRLMAQYKKENIAFIASSENISCELLTIKHNRMKKLINIAY